MIRNSIQPNITSSRSPCPALNTLANHGYLPYDGRDITISELVRGIHEAYGISFPLALLLSVVGVAVCGHWFRLNLEDLASHNRIEHNASITRDDTPPGSHIAPVQVKPARLQSFLNMGTGPEGSFSLADLAGARVSFERNLSVPLDSVHAQIGQGEAALTWLVLKDQNGNVSAEMLREWYGEEKFPKGWTKPTVTIGLFEARAISKKVACLMRANR